EVLTRRYAYARQQFGTDFTPVEGDPMRPGEWMDHAAQADAVINLAGENVVAALARAPRRADGSPKVLVNASAVGYYGPHGDEELTEDSPPGSDFLARVCVDWETAARAAEPLGVRLALVRIGVV